MAVAAWAYPGNAIPSLCFLAYYISLAYSLVLGGAIRDAAAGLFGRLCAPSTGKDSWAELRYLPMRRLNALDGGLGPPPPWAEFQEAAVALEEGGTLAVGSSRLQLRSFFVREVTAFRPPLWFALLTAAPLSCALALLFCAAVVLLSQTSPGSPVYPLVLTFLAICYGAPVLLFYLLSLPAPGAAPPGAVFSPHNRPRNTAVAAFAALLMALQFVPCARTAHAQWLDQNSSMRSTALGYIFPAFVGAVALGSLLRIYLLTRVLPCQTVLVLCPRNSSLTGPDSHMHYIACTSSMARDELVLALARASVCDPAKGPVAGFALSFLRRFNDEYLPQRCQRCAPRLTPEALERLRADLKRDNAAADAAEQAAFPRLQAELLIEEKSVSSIGDASELYSSLKGGNAQNAASERLRKRLGHFFSLREGQAVSRARSHIELLAPWSPSPCHEPSCRYAASGGCSGCHCEYQKTLGFDPERADNAEFASAGIVYKFLKDALKPKDCNEMRRQGVSCALVDVCAMVAQNPASLQLFANPDKLQKLLSLARSDVGPVTTFVSHAWMSSFDVLVDSIDHHAQRESSAARRVEESSYCLDANFRATAAFAPPPTLRSRRKFYWIDVSARKCLCVFPRRLALILLYAPPRTLLLNKHKPF